MISNNHDKSVKHVFSVFPYSFFSVFNHIPFIPGSVFLYSWPLSPPPGLASLHSWLSILSVFLAFVSSSWPCVPSFLAQYSFLIPGLVSLHSWLSILSVFLAFVSSSWPCVPSFLAQYSFRIPGLRLLLLALCPFIPGSVFFPYSWPSSPPPGLVSLHSWLSILSLFLALCPFIPGSVFFPYSWPCVPSFLAQYSFRIPGLRPLIIGCRDLCQCRAAKASNRMMSYSYNNFKNI